MGDRGDQSIKSKVHKVFKVMQNKSLKFKAYLIIFLTVANVFIWYAVSRENREGILTVSFLDVGQGDAIFIDAPNGDQILIDGGPDKKVLRSLGGAIPFYDRSIDLLALTHPHADHLAGLLEVLPRYSVLGFLSSGTKAKTPEYFSLTNYLGTKRPSGMQEVVAKRGTKINLGDGAYIDVLLPITDVASSSPHDGMAVYRLVYGKTSFLFAGDMEKGMENYLVAADGAKLKSDVLKVGHHGSKNSTSEAFLGYVSPKYAVISVGVDNTYGHPAEETIIELEKFGAEVLRTDKLGTVTIKSDGEKISL